MTPSWLYVQLLRRGFEKQAWGPSDGRSFLNEDSTVMVSLRQVRSILCGLFYSFPWLFLEIY